jgi:hypothetical protein
VAERLPLRGPTSLSIELESDWQGVIKAIIDLPTRPGMIERLEGAMIPRRHQYNVNCVHVFTCKLLVLGSCFEFHASFHTIVGLEGGHIVFPREPVSGYNFIVPSHELIVNVCSRLSLCTPHPHPPHLPANCRPVLAKGVLLGR